MHQPHNVFAGTQVVSLVEVRGSHLLPLEKVVGLDASSLPELPFNATRAALDDLLIRTRLAGRA